jgi:drug/metabolite transporter (DMT)-like permease
MSGTKAASRRSAPDDQAAGRQQLSTELLLLVTVGIWAFNFTAVKYGVTHGFSPLSYASLRFFFAGILFAGATLQRERSLRIKRRDLSLLVGAALLGITLNQLAFVYALRLTTASTVALLFGTGPALVALVAHISGTERLHLRSWLGALISLAGVTLVVLGSTGGGISGGLAGVLLGLATAVTWAVYSVAVGPLMVSYSPYRLNAMVTLVGSAPLLIAATPQLAGEDWSQIPTLGWLSFLYSAVVAYLFTNMIWFRAIHRVGATHAAVYANLEPFLGALFAVFVLSEHLGPLQIAGGVVIGLGILIARKRGSLAPPAE